MVDSATQMLENLKGLRRRLGAGGMPCGLSGRIDCLWGRF